MTTRNEASTQVAAGSQQALAAARDGLKRKLRLGEGVIQSILFLCGALSILITIGIVYELGRESWLFFGSYQWEETNHLLDGAIERQWDTFEITSGGTSLEPGDLIRVDKEWMSVLEVNGERIKVERGFKDTKIVPHPDGIDIELGGRVTLKEFFLKTSWNPQIGQFGIWALVNATLMTSLSAMLVALPIGLMIAIYLSEYASEGLRKTIKPTLEVLAGVPTVVYGYFALTFMTPLLRAIFGMETVDIYNTASAGIVIGILIIPFVSSMCEDALRAVPMSLRQAAYGLGATKLETAVKVVVPAALSGIAAAFIVAISRAIGETMIVAIAAGAGPKFTFNPFSSAETMTGHIVRISGGDISYDSLDYNSLFAIGLMLFVMTLGLNIVSQQIVRRFREEYE